MSTMVFPTLPGMDIAIKRTPIYATKVQTASSGKELRASFQSSPRYRYALPLNFLRQAVLNTSSDEASQLLSFFGTHKGKWDSFWLPDPMAVNLIPNGTSEEANPTAFGSLLILATNPYQGTKSRGSHVNAGVGYTGMNITDKSDCSPGDQFYLECMACVWQTGWNAYMGAIFSDASGATLATLTTSVSTSGTYVKVNGVVTAPANAASVLFYVESDGPLTDNWGWWDNIFACRLATAGIPAAPDGTLTRVMTSADGLSMQLHRKVRFDTDELDFERFLAQVWEAKSLPFISVK